MYFCNGTCNCTLCIRPPIILACKFVGTGVSHFFPVCPVRVIGRGFSLQFYCKTFGRKASLFETKIKTDQTDALHTHLETIWH